jgi:tetratricopeptide (TPR) repeat protein
MGRVLANMNLGNTDRVLEDCRIIRERYPNLNIAAYMYEAMAYLSLEQFDKAREVLGEGIRHIPMGAMNFFPLMIRALTAEGRSESEAVAEVKRVLREAPSAVPGEEDFKEYILAIISAADPNADYDKSIAEQRERIAAMDKPGIVPYTILLTYYLVREDMDGAIAEMNAAVTRSPRDSAPYAVRALAGFAKAYVELGKGPMELWTAFFQNESGAIIADCDRAISLDGNLAGAYQIRGLAKTLAKLPGAEEDLSEAIRLGQDTKENWQARGWSFFYTGKYSAARKDFIQALNIDKDYQDALYGLAKSCAALGDHRRAVDFYTRYIQGNADSIKGFHYRGESLRALGETTLAEDDFAKARELNTENREIWEFPDFGYGFNFDF